MFTYQNYMYSISVLMGNMCYLTDLDVVDLHCEYATTKQISAWPNDVGSARITMM